eukprot:Rmarinus@m.17830
MWKCYCTRLGVVAAVTATASWYTARQLPKRLEEELDVANHRLLRPRVGLLPRKEANAIVDFFSTKHRGIAVVSGPIGCGKRTLVEQSLVDTASALRDDESSDEGDAIPSNARNMYAEVPDNADVSKWLRRYNLELPFYWNFVLDIAELFTPFSEMLFHLLTSNVDAGGRSVVYFNHRVLFDENNVGTISPSLKLAIRLAEAGCYVCISSRDPFEEIGLAQHTDTPIHFVRLSDVSCDEVKSYILSHILSNNPRSSGNEVLHQNHSDSHRQSSPSIPHALQEENPSKTTTCSSIDSDTTVDKLLDLLGGRLGLLSAVLQAGAKTTNGAGIPDGEAQSESSISRWEQMVGEAQGIIRRETALLHLLLLEGLEAERLEDLTRERLEAAEASKSGDSSVVCSPHGKGSDISSPLGNKCDASPSSGSEGDVPREGHNKLTPTSLAVHALDGLRTRAMRIYEMKDGWRPHELYQVLQWVCLGLSPGVEHELRVGTAEVLSQPRWPLVPSSGCYALRMDDVAERLFAGRSEPLIAMLRAGIVEACPLAVADPDTGGVRYELGVTCTSVTRHALLDLQKQRPRLCQHIQDHADLCERDSMLQNLARTSEAYEAEQQSLIVAKRTLDQALYDGTMNESQHREACVDLNGLSVIADSKVSEIGRLRASVSQMQAKCLDRMQAYHQIHASLPSGIMELAFWRVDRN